MNFTITRSDGSDDTFGDAESAPETEACSSIEDGDRHILYGPGGWVRVEADEEIGSLPVVVEGPEDAFGTDDRCIHVVVENPNR